uniref:Uncharacterized protein n=1 Tax=Meloidogyne incognita TaxID=6306 RepID=A0A914LA24_MELIC
MTSVKIFESLDAIVLFSFYIRGLCGFVSFTQFLALCRSGLVADWPVPVFSLAI